MNNKTIDVYFVGYSLLTSVDVALEIIQVSIIPILIYICGYRLTYLVGNSVCTFGTRAMIALAKNTFHSEHNVAGIVGLVCSGAATIAPLIVLEDQVNLLQITVVASPLLTGEEYPNMYLALSTALVHVDIIELQKKYYITC